MVSGLSDGRENIIASLSAPSMKGITAKEVSVPSQIISLFSDQKWRATSRCICQMMERLVLMERLVSFPRGFGEQQQSLKQGPVFCWQQQTTTGRRKAVTCFYLPFRPSKYSKNYTFTIAFDNLQGVRISAGGCSVGASVSAA
jgi:hypothetical protein